MLWLDFLACCDSETNDHPSLMGFAYAIEKEGIDLSEIQRQLKNKEPSNWSDPVFGNKHFVKQILKREGWLPGSVHDEQKEQPPTGPPMQTKALADQ